MGVSQFVYLFTYLKNILLLSFEEFMNKGAANI